MTNPTDTIDSHYRLIPLSINALDDGGRAENDVALTCATVHDAVAKAASLDPRETPFAAVVAPGAILNHDFASEAATAVTDPALEGLRWMALVSDGIDISGTPIDTGNSLDDPAVPRVDPVRIVRWTDPAVAVIDVAALGSVASEGDLPPNLARLTRSAATQGLPVYLSPWLRSSSIHKRVIAPPPNLAHRGYDPAIDIEPSTVRPDPSISIVVRTTLERPALLRRSLAALDAEHLKSAILEVLLTSSAAAEALAATASELVSRHPNLPLRAVHVATSGIPSRSAALAGGLEAARGDYVWFVDDDDWISDGSLERIKRAVHGVDRPILVGAVDAFDEVWSGTTLVEADLNRRYLPEEWYRAFTGWNFLPNCSVVAPRTLALDRLSSSPITANFGEDYALQLLLLTAPGAAVQVVEGPIANVSVRVDGDNAVTLEDRTPWLRDLGTHISNLARDPAASTAAFWRLGHAMRELPYPVEESPVSEAIENEPETEWQPHPLARFVPSRVRPTLARVRRRFRTPE